MSATADADEPHRFSVGIDVFEYFPSISVEPDITATRSPAQHTGITEIDALVPIDLKPWLRIVPLVGFTVLSFHFNSSNDPPDLAAIDQNAIVIGAGTQAFHRYGSWEIHADLQLRVPFAIGGANAMFFGGEQDNDQLAGGAFVTLSGGAARRLGGSEDLLRPRLRALNHLGSRPWRRFRYELRRRPPSGRWSVGSQ